MIRFGSGVRLRYSITVIITISIGMVAVEKSEVSATSVREGPMTNNCFVIEHGRGILCCSRCARDWIFGESGRVKFQLRIR